MPCVDRNLLLSSQAEDIESSRSLEHLGAASRADESPVSVEISASVPVSVSVPVHLFMTSVVLRQARAEPEFTSSTQWPRQGGREGEKERERERKREREKEKGRR